MKVQPINNNNYHQTNTSFKKASDICKYGVGALIASTTLFMGANALDTFKKEKVGSKPIASMNMIASLLGIAGTSLAIFGIEQEENNDKHR